MSTPPEGQPTPSGQFPGQFPGQATPAGGQPAQYPAQTGGQPGQFPGAQPPGQFPGQQQPGQFPGAQQPGQFPGQAPADVPPGAFPGAQQPGLAQPGYGQQPGQGFVPPPGYAPGIPMAPGVPMRPRRRAALWIRLSILGVVVVVGLIFWLINSKTDPGHANVGDCLSGDVNNADSVKQVSCTDSTATYKVVGTLDNQTELDFNAEQDPCTQYQNADSAFWEGEDGQTGTTLCLQQLTK